MREIKLYGELGRQFGRVHRFDVATPAEAVRAMCSQFAGFEQHLIKSGERGVGYLVLVGRDPVARTQLHDPSSWREPIRIAPVIGGRAKGWAQVVIGIALIVASFYTGGAASAGFLTEAGLSGAAAASVSGAMFSIGVSLALTGVTRLLSPTPLADSPSEADKHRPSYIFNGPVNTIAQGQCVPVGYGRMIVGSAQISASVDLA